MIPILQFTEKDIKDLYLRSVMTHRNNVLMKWTRDNTNLLLLLVKQHKSCFGKEFNFQRLAGFVIYNIK